MRWRRRERSSYITIVLCLNGERVADYRVRADRLEWIGGSGDGAVAQGPDTTLTINVPVTQTFGPATMRREDHR